MSYKQEALKARLPLTFQTERLNCRIIESSDAESLYEALSEDWSEFLRWMAWGKEGAPPKSRTEQFAKASRAKFESRDQFSFLIQLHQTVIGTCSVPRLDWEVPLFEIGYWLRASARGQGFMSEAVSGLRDYLIAHLSPARIEIRCDVKNEASVGVALRAGFSKKAVLQRYRRNNQGELADELILTCLPENT